MHDFGTDSPSLIAFAVVFFDPKQRLAPSLLLMSGHNFSVSVKPEEEDWKAVPGLQEKLPWSATRSVLDCAHGCGLARVPGKTFWVDLAARLLVTDTRTSACTHSAAPADGGTAGTARRGAVKHARLDVIALMDQCVLPNAEPPRPAAASDDYLMERTTEARRLALEQAGALVPTTWAGHLSALTAAINRLSTAFAAVLWAATEAAPAATARGASGAASGGGNPPSKLRLVMASASASDEMQTTTIAKNQLMLQILTRGLAEYQQHASRTYQAVYGGAPAAAFFAQLTEVMRPDLDALREVLGDPKLFGADLAARVDANPFFVLGAVATTRNRAGLAAFWRAERARYEAVAKALSVKPSAPVAATARSGDAPGAAAAAAAGGGTPAAAPSPERADGGQTSVTGKRSTKGQPRPGKSPPRKRGNKKGKGTGKDGTPKDATTDGNPARPSG